MPDIESTAHNITVYLNDALCCPGELDPDTDLLAAGLVDSLMIMDLVEHLQVTYGLHFTADDFRPQNFRSANAMSELVARKRNEAETMVLSHENAGNTLM